MPRTFSTLLAIRVSSAANRFIFYARKLPLLGKRIPDSVYASLEVKKAAAIVAFIAAVLWGFVSKLAYTGLLVYLPVAVFGGEMPQEDGLRLFLHIFALLSFVAAGVSSATVLEPKREKYIAVKLMRMLPAAYMRTSLGYRYITYFIYYVPALLLFGSLLGASAAQSLALAASVTLWRVFCEYLHLMLFDQTGVILIRQNLIAWLAIGLGYLAAYAPLVLDGAPNVGALLLGWPFACVIAAPGLFAAVRLARYGNYRAAVDAAARRDDPLLDLGRMMSEAQKAGVQSQVGDYAAAERQTGKLANLEGYAYLNALFFARHRRLIARPVYQKLAIIGIVGVLGAGFAAAGGQWFVSLAANPEPVFPFLALALSLLSVGEAACRAIFYNCDLPLLRYSYYRSAASRHFRIRLRRIAGLNLMLGVAMAIAVTAVVVAGGGELDRNLLLLWLCAPTLSFFFAIHHLLMYYILQPYSTELNVRNPFYFITSIAVSAICWIGIVLRPSALVYTAVALVATAVYLAAALVLVRKFGHRTFRVK